jgi:CheY-specific phosphatase CheX
MSITDGDLTRIADEICRSLFAREDAVPDDAGTVATVPDRMTRTLTAIVDINGDFNGSVSVRCRRTTAERIASVMFDAPEPDLSREDVIDALGEFANMAAGAVKGMLDGDKTLGLPTVGEGIDYIMVVPHTTEILGIDYPVADDLVRLSLHQAVARSAT